MQVLVENPYSPLDARPLGLSPSFWSPSTYYFSPHFSMGNLMSESIKLGLSPYVVVDARVALFLSQLTKGTSVYTRNLGALGVVVAQFVSLSVTHNEDSKKVANYLKEYITPKEMIIAPDLALYDQVVIFGECDIQDHLWEKLKVGGYYLLASYSEGLQITRKKEEYAVVKMSWPQGKETEFGWRFDEEELGLFGFEFTKLKKLK